MNFPRMSLHVGDYLRDTRHLRAAGHGAYLLLIMHYWSTGGLPKDDDQLAAIACMTDKEWQKHKPAIQALFRPGWKHKRIDAELATVAEKYKRKVEAGKRSATAKWGDAAGRLTRSERLARAREIATHTELEWLAMVDVFGGCVKCGLRNEDLEGEKPCKDHIIPIAVGGSDGIENIQPLCRGCNSSKSHVDRTDYRDAANKTWRKRLTECLTEWAGNAPITLNPNPIKKEPEQEEELEEVTDRDAVPISRSGE